MTTDQLIHIHQCLERHRAETICCADCKLYGTPECAYNVAADNDALAAACPHFGQELPPGHHCPPDCPVGQECYWAYQNKCALCGAPATIDGLCDDCYNATNAPPDPLCAECGQALPAEDVERGETICLECTGKRLMAEIGEEGVLLARVRVRLGGRD